MGKMTSTIESTARAVCASIKHRRGYSVFDDRGHAIVFIPTPIVAGLCFPSGIIVIEVGHGSVIIESPKRLNRFVLAKSGFTLPAGDFVAKVIKRLAVLIAVNEVAVNEVAVNEVEADKALFSVGLRTCVENFV